MIKLMKGDCLERMKEIESGSVDMILTDPPYEMFLQKSMKRLKSGMLRGDDRKFQEQLKNEGLTVGFDVKSFLTQCLSLFDKKQKFCGVFTCSTKQVVEYISWAEEKKLQYGIGVWHKTNPAPLCNCKYLNDVEYWIYIKGNKSKILGNYHTKSMVYTSKINKKDKSEFGHPTCKPVELMEKFITNHSLEGQTILDPFMGSGSTGVAAKNLSRNFIGIELDDKYFEIAKERINGK
ncbi:DNA methylase [Vibrio phage 1.071.A._10N.286.46.A12]|nr:DNA methylase [Vibrio phage 1.071.A._10N.286.46.A12]